MYNTSQNYKDKVLSDSTQHELNIYIDGNKVDSNHIIDFKQTIELFNNNEFCLGCTPEIDIEFEIDKRDLPETYNEVYIETGVDEEIVPIGYFTIQKPIEDNEFKVKIKATDYMKKFEDNKYDGSDLAYPQTMLQVLKDICKKIGVELGSTSFLNSDKQIAVYDNTVSARTYLGDIAEQAEGIAVIGRDRKLYIRQIGQDIINFDINLFKDYKWGDKFKVSKVSYEDGIQDYKFGDETADTVYIDQNNMYIVDSEQIENIYKQIKDFEIYSFEGETIIDPAYDIGDILVIDGKQVLYQGELEYAGKFKVNIKSKIQAKTEQESMQTKENTTTKMRRVQSEIDQANAKITQRVESVETTTLKNVEVQYALSDSTTIAPTNGWSTTAPEWQSEKYMWQKTISTYFNGRIIESEPTCIQGAKGERGLQGLQGDKGEQGIQGPKGDTGAKGDKGDTGATGSTGAKGEKGDKGDTGDSGATTYFHIKYSPVENPTSSQMSETPNTYIGTYVDFIEEDSSDPTKYTWFQFKGSQGEKGEKGIAGTNGTDGKTSYLHIAYANNSSGTSGFSVSDSTNKTYIGQYTDFEENDSTDPTKYSWTKIKGDTGSAGKGVKSVTNTYQAGSSGTTAPTGTWSTSIPETTADKPYLWTMTVTTYTDNTTSTAYAIGATPEGITVGGRNYILKSNKFIASTGCGTGITNSIEDEIWKIVTASGNSNYLSFSKENTIEDNFKDDDEFTFSVEIKCDEGSTGKPTIYFKSGMGYYNMIGEVSTEYSTLYYTGKWKSANEIRFHLGWSSTVGTFYIRRIKFEKGNKATDWTPAPEDIESSIEGVQTDANEALTSASNAQTIADKAMTAVDQLSRIISELVTDADGTSMMTQTSKGWTFNMSSITDNIEALRNGLDTLNNNQGSTSDLLYKIRDLVDSIDKKTAYINIGTDDNGNPCIELGKADNDFKVRITNTAIDFMEGSTKIAYANNNTFYVEKMIVKNELQIGESLGFVWRTRANGNLGLVPISQ